MANSTAPAANGGGSPPNLTAVGAPAEDDGEPIVVERSAADIASRSIYVTLGGKRYRLEVLFIAGNERWREYEEERTSGYNAELGRIKDQAKAVALLNAEPDLWLDLLYAYDTDCGRKAGVLPPRDELKESIYEDEPQTAINEVVKAANPKAVAAWERRARTMAAAAMSASSPRTSTSPARTAGRSKRSASH